MDAIIELSYKPPPQSGVTIEDVPGVYATTFNMYTHSGPGPKFPVKHILVAGMPRMIDQKATIWPANDIWVRQASNGEWIAFIVGDKIFGKIEDWPFR